MADDPQSELSEPGVLRVAINLGNILLVTGKAPGGEPQGVAPDLAAGEPWRPVPLRPRRCFLQPVRAGSGDKRRQLPAQSAARTRFHRRWPTSGYSPWHPR